MASGNHRPLPGQRVDGRCFDKGLGQDSFGQTTRWPDKEEPSRSRQFPLSQVNSCERTPPWQLQDTSSNNPCGNYVDPAISGRLDQQANEGDVAGEVERLIWLRWPHLHSDWPNEKGRTTRYLPVDRRCLVQTRPTDHQEGLPEMLHLEQHGRHRRRHSLGTPCSTQINHRRHQRQRGRLQWGKHVPPDPSTLHGRRIPAYVDVRWRKWHRVWWLLPNGRGRWEVWLKWFSFLNHSRDPFQDRHLFKKDDHIMSLVGLGQLVPYQVNSALNRSYPPAKSTCFSSEFSAENSDIAVFMHRGTDAQVNSYPTKSTWPWMDSTLPQNWLVFVRIFRPKLWYTGIYAPRNWCPCQLIPNQVNSALNRSYPAKSACFRPNFPPKTLIYWFLCTTVLMP